MARAKEQLSYYERRQKYLERRLRKAIFRQNRGNTGVGVTLNVAPNKLTKDKGQTPLHAALKNPTTSAVIIQILLDRGAQVNAPNKKWQLPWHVFCANIQCLNQNTMQKAALLLEAGADFTRPDIKGKSGFDLVPPPFQLTFFKWVATNTFSPNKIIHRKITRDFLQQMREQIMVNTQY